MTNLLRKSLALEITNFWEFLKLKATQKFTKSAFVQARMKIKPEVFKHLSEKLTTEFYTDNDVAIKKWCGFRLLAVDGSRITLPNTLMELIHSFLDLVSRLHFQQTLLP